MLTRHLKFLGWETLLSVAICAVIASFWTVKDALAIFMGFLANTLANFAYSIYCFGNVDFSNPGKMVSKAYTGLFVKLILSVSVLLWTWRRTELPMQEVAVSFAICVAVHQFMCCLLASRDGE